MLDEKAWRRDETYRIEVPSLAMDDPGFHAFQWALDILRAKVRGTDRGFILVSISSG